MLISIGGQTDSAKDAVKRVEASQLTSLAAFYASTNGGSYEGICRSDTFTEGDGGRLLKSLIQYKGNSSLYNLSNTDYGRVGIGLSTYQNIDRSSVIMVCIDRNQVNQTKDIFALYWPTSLTTVGCLDSVGNIVLNGPLSNSRFNPLRGRSPNIYELNGIPVLAVLPTSSGFTASAGNCN